ncbi:hypothetical protein BH23PAT2_BH23PAT2_06960 [soil metagenome]|jgi:hypothetical protein
MKKLGSKQDSTTSKTAVAEKSQDEEAKELLAKMEAKKEAGDCPFC